MGEQGEDCLSLNITTPGLDGSRPVLVWIHGGAFVGGSGSVPWYDGESFARNGDVVVVSINYRLGALGFLHVGHLLGEAYADSGSAGIADQITALEWVRDNIAAFGGDPNRVTVFGESAGGMSVGSLLGSPHAKGLFTTAIAQSGAAHNASTTERAAEVTALVLAQLGLSEAGADGLLSIGVDELMAAQNAVYLGSAAGGGGLGTAGMPFQPVAGTPTLPIQPIDAIRDGNARSRPRRDRYDDRRMEVVRCVAARCAGAADRRRPAGARDRGAGRPRRRARRRLPRQSPGPVGRRRLERDCHRLRVPDPGDPHGRSAAEPPRRCVRLRVRPSLDGVRRRTRGLPRHRDPLRVRQRPPARGRRARRRNRRGRAGAGDGNEYRVDRRGGG